jgi:hypothetical protein
MSTSRARAVAPRIAAIFGEPEGLGVIARVTP